MPYTPGLPEFDLTIEKAMRIALNKLVTDDSECERVIKSMNGIFPPPEKHILPPFIKELKLGFGFEDVNSKPPDRGQRIEFYA
jgi:hypothetical protein